MSLTMIQHSRPWLDVRDELALTGTLRSKMIGQGVRVAAFEAAFAAHVGGVGGVAVGSGAAALVLALRQVGICPGDEVVLPTYVCVSVLQAAIDAGAVPVLCDVGPEWTVTADAVAAVVTPRSRAVIVPHMYGIFADVKSIKTLGLLVIEDCAQAVGAAGQMQLGGDVAAYSFHPTKCLTTGEGGMAVAVEPAVIAGMRTLRDGGDIVCARLMSPMSDIAGALGLSQLARYGDMLARRYAIAMAYRDAVGEHADFYPPVSAPRMYFRFPLRVPGGLDAVGDRFRELGIQVRRGVDCLLHRLLGLSDDRFPIASAHFENTVSIPIYPALDDSEVERCVKALRRVLA